MNLNQIASILDGAALHAKATQQVSHFRQLSLDEAYAIQSISIGRRYERGEKKLGLKLGFTSKAKMEQMGVHDMIWGRLTDQMKYQDNGELILGEFIHPRAEPEIAFKISKDIPEMISLEEASKFVDGLAVAIEIIDSRFENFKFSLEDVVADNCSSTGFCLGEWLPVNTNIKDIGIELLIDDEIIQSGNSNAILGNPWESLVAAARLAISNGEPLKSGDIVLAGAATSAVYIKANQTISAKAVGLGKCSLRVK